MASLTKVAADSRSGVDVYTTVLSNGDGNIDIPVGNAERITVAFVSETGGTPFTTFAIAAVEESGGATRAYPSATGVVAVYSAPTTTDIGWVDGPALTKTVNLAASGGSGARTTTLEIQVFRKR